MPKEVFVSKGFTSFLKGLCGKRLQRCLVECKLPVVINRPGEQSL